MFDAAKALAMIAVDLLARPGILDKVKEEFTAQLKEVGSRD